MGYDPRQRRADTSHECDDQTVIALGRINHVRDICDRAMEYDKGSPGFTTTGGLTDRQWLARSVLNILDGNIDAQIREEARR